jgi:hypothetical protein
MLRLGGFMFGALAVASVAHAQESKSVQSTLPAGNGKEWVTEYCAKCHELKRIEEDQGTEAEWITRIRRMIRRGATIPAERIEPLGKYLAQALPPRLRLQSGESSPIATAVAEATVRPIQTWVRAAGTLQDDITIAATLQAPDSNFVKAGQRVKAFALGTRSSMYQGKVTRVTPTAKGAQIAVQLAARTAVASDTYLLEIITEQAPVLSIPNEAVIEEGDHRLVYLQQGANYVPRNIQVGRQGELHTEVVAGLASGDNVVTFGSFFIDAEFKLKVRDDTPASGSNLTIEYLGSPNPPREGSNSVEVIVTDANGKPKTDAAVDVTYSMAAMPSMNMPEMRDSFSLQHQGKGKYAGNIRLSMAGTWQVNVVVSKDGRPIDRKELSVIAK